MTGALRHRGPDDASHWLDEASGVALGHRRLSIIDLSPHGRQPMVSADGRHVITFNGELYNYQGLRADEERRGHVFRGHSDTEVLLARISRLGLLPALAETRAMLALAIFDRKERSLTLARDRLGEKPLYFGWVEDSLVFASELRALEVLPGWRGEVSGPALRRYLSWGYVPGPESIYAGVSKVSPGAAVVFHLESPRFEPPVERRYWTVPRPDTPVAGAAPEDLVESADCLLRSVVQRQMVSDVPLGALLSGGIDSSLVVSLMQATCPTRVQTFSLGFPDSVLDESAFARGVARHLATDHHELQLTAQDLYDVVPRLGNVYDEPLGDTSQVPTVLIAEFARQRVTVCLSGDGGDELFGGYSRYLLGSRVTRALGWIPAGVRRCAARGVTGVGADGWDRLGRLRVGRQRWWNGDRALKAAAMLDFQDGMDLYGRLVRHWRAPELVLSPDLQPGHSKPGRLPVLDPPEGPLLRRMMYVDQTTYLPDDIFLKVDRAAMAVGLEVRAPLVDADVAAFAAALPIQALTSRGRGKWILRQVLRRYVPPALFERPKRGFSAPVGVWLRGPLREWAGDLLSADRLVRQGVFDAVAISRYWAEHQAGRRNWQYHLWDVLMFQAWWDVHRPGGVTGSQK